MLFERSEELSVTVTNNLTLFRNNASYCLLRNNHKKLSEGTSGKAIHDIKSLTIDPVVFLVLMRSGRMCMRSFLQIQSKNMKKNIQLVVFCVTDS